MIQYDEDIVVVADDDDDDDHDHDDDGDPPFTCKTLIFLLFHDVSPEIQ